jgi:hypothetical protein
MLCLQILAQDLAAVSADDTHHNCAKLFPESPHAAACEAELSYSLEQLLTHKPHFGCDALQAYHA